MCLTSVIMKLDNYHHLEQRSDLTKQNKKKKGFDGQKENKNGFLFSVDAVLYQ